MGLSAAIAAVAVAGTAGGLLGSSMGSKPSAPAAPPTTAQTDPANENEAQKASERRRRAYAGVGRSSTILTQGLGQAPIGQQDSAPKQLLGL